MAVAASLLPPGVYERDGKYYRKITFEGVDENGIYEEDDEREVILPIATDEKSIHESRERAARLALDFYDPRTVLNQQTGERITIGWLDRGKKRHEDWPWNLGSGVPRSRRYKNARSKGKAAAADSQPVVSDIQEVGGTSNGE